MVKDCIGGYNPCAYMVGAEGSVEYEQAYGIVLKRERLLRGMKQEQLAAACNCHPTYISQIERGKRNPTGKVTLRIAYALGMTYAHFCHLIEQEMLKSQSTDCQ